MKASTVLLSAWLAGCSTVAETGTAVDGGAGDAPRQPTTFPTGSEDGGAHQPYPFVLCHGLDGFESIGPINYFYGVADALRKDGHEVFTSQVDAYNSSEVRGAQLLIYVQGVLSTTGAAKVNLICHSQGGLDCRYVASKMGANVASVTTISTPHYGTPVADIATGVLPGPMQTALEAMLNVLGAVISQKPDMNAEAALQLLTYEGGVAFGKRHPDDPHVAYYSIAGRSNMASGADVCATPTEAPFVARWNLDLDPIDPLLSIPGAILNNYVKPPPSNDGLVPVSSAKYGTFLGCIPADHLDEMCQLANDYAGLGNRFDCHLFYRQLAEWLVARGH